jgi:hypothetical protein
VKLTSDGGNTGSKKCKIGYGGAYCGLWCILLLTGLESGVGVLDRNLASVAVMMFSHLIYFTKKIYKIVLSMRFAKIMLQ